MTTRRSLPKVPAQASEDSEDELTRDIGVRLRLARRAVGLSQSDLGSCLGVSFQQIQKYENGKNRLSASALILVARTLSMNPVELLGLDRTGRTRIDLTAFADDEASDQAKVWSTLSPRRRTLMLQLIKELTAD